MTAATRLTGYVPSLTYCGYCLTFNAERQILDLDPGFAVACPPAREARILTLHRVRNHLIGRLCSLFTPVL